MNNLRIWLEKSASFFLEVLGLFITLGVFVLAMPFIAIILIPLLIFVIAVISIPLLFVLIVVGAALKVGLIIAVPAIIVYLILKLFKRI